MAAALLQIRACIQNGSPLRTGFYSKKAGREQDKLLEADGIMHLHLGASNTKDLLFVVEYDEHVVLLELNDHSPFKTDPPGRALATRHRKGLAAAEADIDAAAAARKKRKVVLRPRSLPEEK